ncbi:hypothetical protein DXN04_14235 [Chitinophaga silvisoli]|uniref:Uncharacterized protein n=1 Tax=Chitinophaga silvisoli TaxID=2291814 RepID=A0A3E1P2P5_9BACT|nr:hypothetical protein DXN04_14235 [Chitinophaga silvisoli]
MYILNKIHMVPIKRHIKVKGNFTDNPVLKEYWEKRRYALTKIGSQKKVTGKSLKSRTTGVQFI